MNLLNDSDNPLAHAEQILPLTTVEDGNSFSVVISKQPRFSNSPNDLAAAAVPTQNLAWLATPSPSRPEVLPVPTDAVPPPGFSEHTRLMILDVAMQLKQTDAQSLSAVVKIDPQTELSIQFTLQAGQVEAVAQVRQGDYTALAAHWGSLQSQLAEQGIRLAALERPPNADAAGVGNHDSGTPHREPHPQPPELSLRPPPTPPKGSQAPLPRTGAARCGWEFWA